MGQPLERSQIFLPKSKVNLSYVQAGQGEHTLVLVHGLGSNSKAFTKNIGELSKKTRVIAIDLPGFGDTEPGEFVPGMDNYAHTIAEFVSLKGLDKISLVGHSMGGQIAMHLAATHQPEWLRQLVLLAPAGVEQFTAAEKEWFHAVVNEAFYLNLTDEQIEQNFDLNFYGNKLPKDAQFMLQDRLEIKEDLEQYKQYVATVVKSIHAMLKEPVYHQIENIKVPVKVVFGKEDKLIPNKILHPQLTTEGLVESLTMDYPTIDHVLLEQAGHFVQWDQSEAVNSIILKDIN
ncbi:alpha/beta fold hydrolase [Arenibacter lacus]|uniref:alpha/beta fold hydrolase n=1 Tax=Arenibacter lacus TaxID=2608629 RepID=UPI00168B2879|nr:alpha/beta hydrolase [Arenibacter lacus]